MRRAPVKLSYGRLREGEIDSLRSLLAISYGLSGEAWTGWFARIGLDHLRVLRRDDEVIGGLGAYRFGHFYGGKSVQSAGIAGVGVAPEHRSSGAARDMLIAALREHRKNGLPLASLYASTQHLYRSLGFEHAAHGVTWRAPAASLAPASVDRSVEVRRLARPTREALEGTYVAAAKARAGHVDRNQAMWDRKLGAAGPDDLAAYVFGPRSQPEGYLVYAVERVDNHRFDVRVRDLVWHTPRAARSILRFLYDQRSLVRDAVWLGPPNDPLQLLLHEQTAKVERTDRVFVRVLDVTRALEARGYEAEGEVAFEIDDPVFRENSRAWSLRVAGGTGRVTPVKRAPLRMTIQALASLMSGMYDARQLSSVGALVGPEGSVEAARRLFAGPVPWCADMF